MLHSCCLCKRQMRGHQAHCHAFRPIEENRIRVRRTATKQRTTSFLFPTHLIGTPPFPPPFGQNICTGGPVSGKHIGIETLEQPWPNVGFHSLYDDHLLTQRQFLSSMMSIEAILARRLFSGQLGSEQVTALSERPVTWETSFATFAHQAMVVECRGGNSRLFDAHAVDGSSHLRWLALVTHHSVSCETLPTTALINLDMNLASSRSQLSVDVFVSFCCCTGNKVQGNLNPDLGPPPPLALATCSVWPKEQLCAETVSPHSMRNVCNVRAPHEVCFCVIAILLLRSKR